jgi:hypothetical protein
MTKQRRRPGVPLQAALTLGVVIVVALSAAGAMRGATSNSSPTVTTKVMVEGLKAIHYPVGHPKRLTCRGLGATLNGRHTSFRCDATLKTHRQRRFYTRAVAQGGWFCAGKTLSGCVMLGRGFVPASAADNQGWQEIAVVGWLQAHNIDGSGALGVSCIGTKSPMICTLRTKPPVTVALAYSRVGAGYVETASRS